MSDEQGSGDFIRITNRMVWDKLNELEAQLDGLDRRQDIILADSKNLRDTMGANVQTNTGRIEKLEGRFNGVLIGLGTGIVVAIAAVFRGVVG